MTEKEEHEDWRLRGKQQWPFPVHPCVSQNAYPVHTQYSLGRLLRTCRGYPKANGIIICGETKEDNFWKPRAWTSLSELLIKTSRQGSLTKHRDSQEAGRISHSGSNTRIIITSFALPVTSLLNMFHCQTWRGVSRVLAGEWRRERERRGKCIISHTWPTARMWESKTKSKWENECCPQHIFTIKWKKNIQTASILNSLLVPHDNV